MDEPTNFLDLCVILWLQSYIENLQPEVTVLLVSHDRDFVNAVCSDIILLRDRSLTYFNGNIAAHEKFTTREVEAESDESGARAGNGAFGKNNRAKHAAGEEKR